MPVFGIPANGINPLELPGYLLFYADNRQTFRTKITQTPEEQWGKTYKFVRASYMQRAEREDGHRKR